MTKIKAWARSATGAWARSATDGVLPAPSAPLYFDGVPVTTIVSDRLELVSLSPEFLAASLAADRPALERILGCVVPEEWLQQTALVRLRQSQLAADPELAPWLLRAMILRRERLMVGHIGFHAAPNAPYLASIAPGGVEFGYTVYEPYRRKGYARESCAALMSWAREAHNVTRFVLSIGIGNIASQQLAARLGFHKVGQHVDEEDGPEDIFLRASS